MIESGTRCEHRTSVVARHEPGRGLVWRARCRELECEHPPTGWHLADGATGRAGAEADARQHALYPTGAAVITTADRRRAAWLDERVGQWAGDLDDAMRPAIPASVEFVYGPLL